MYRSFITIAGILIIVAFARGIFCFGVKRWPVGLIIRKGHSCCSHLVAYPLSALVRKKERLIKMEGINDIFIAHRYSPAQFVNAVKIGCAYDQCPLFIDLADSGYDIVSSIFPSIGIHVRRLIIDLKK